MRRAFTRLRVRLTLASFLLSLLLVAGAVGALLGSLHAGADDAIAARLQDRAAALAATVTDQPGGVDVRGADDALFDSPNWVFDASGGLVEGSRISGALGAAVTALGTTRTAETRTVGLFHLRTAPVGHRGRVVAVAVTGVDETPYLATLDATTRGAVLLGALAVLGTTALAALVLARALGPIAAMTEQAARWSRAHSGRRFSLGPPKDEVSALAHVLDELLDRVEEALAAERRLTAEIAHELRTPLTLLSGEAELALMSRTTAPAELERYRRIHAAAGAMARAITALLEDAAAGPSDADCDLREAVEAVVAAVGGRVDVQVSGRSLRVPVPFAQLERMLAPVMQNAAEAAAGTVRIELGGEAGTVTVSDDGPGIADAVAGGLFTPGVTTRPSGTGLGLALALRLTRDAGGDLELVSTRPAVLRFTLPRTAPGDLRPGLRSGSGSVAAG